MNMKTLILTLVFCVALAAQGAANTYTGVITDTMCAKDHTHMGVAPEAKCVRDCVKSGQYKYALLVGDNVYVLSDQQTPEKFAAQKVRVKGVYYEKTRILKVESIEAAR
jgi:hypothetical protein